jgi:hypothetical protein
MAIDHEVQPGEGISSLGEKYGLAPETIWNDPANAELKRLREDGNVLLPGDRLTIPDKRVKSVAVATGRSHRFRRIGIPARLRLQLLVNDHPRADEEYRLEVEGRVIEGRTDADGVLDVAVPPQAREARLVVGPDAKEILLRIGHLDPHTEVTGVQNRLANLGFLGLPPSGEWDEPTREALRAFQKKEGLPVTGEADEDTRRKLAEVHDCIQRGGAAG